VPWYISRAARWLSQQVPLPTIGHAATGFAAPRRLGTGGPWFCVLPRSAWPSDTDKVAAIERDMEGETGDRRQELVLIGRQDKAHYVSDEPIIWRDQC
jgi:hypothetical protein